jgi:hypothetical protein
MPPILLANVQSLENTMYDLLLRLFYQQGIINCNILCFAEMWLNEDSNNIELAEFSMHQAEQRRYLW